MANNKAKGASRTVVWIILLLLVIGLGGFGAVNFSGNVRAVGSVGDTPIPVSRYQRQLRQDLLTLQQQTGMNLGIAEAKSFGLDRAALAKVVDQVALENEATRMGLSVGDVEVQKRLTQIADFQGFDGKFDPQVYRDTLSRAGIAVGTFEDEIRATAARGLLARAIGTGVAMPEQMTESVYNWAGERRSFVWTELTASDLPEPIPEPSDADLKDWYDSHADLYTLPEARRITYAWITPSMLVDKVDVDEDALRKLYDSRAAEYHKPERRLVERLAFGTEEEAQAAMEAIAKGETDFETLVEERGLTLDDVNLDEVTREDLGPAGDAVFALSEPGLAGPVETDLGPAIFRVNAILDATDTPYEDVRDELKNDYATDRARRMIQDMTEQVNDLLASGATLEDLAGETDLELGTIDYTDAMSDGLAGYAAFRQTAATVTTEDFPEAIALDDGGLFAMRLDKIIPPTLQPQDEVQDKVAADWKAAETKTALEALADELLPRIESGEDPASFGLTVNHEDALTRDAYLADVPTGLVAKAFELAPGTAARIDGTEGTPTVALVRTDEVLPPDPENTDLLAAREEYARQMDDQLTGDLVDAFTAAVRETAGIKIDEAAVNAVNASFQ
ncbi:peptidylprolyl isomerase [Frigidibacter sp. ROC022]|uniref:peptidylprolyl isomerase n=1 Tax=Frigidibacter sp. ROC022 TaxID=2971796 RepID=UPI00215A5E9E|nr:peptidylprolyl isomerase [Frigidibacter sp. ROC022]MCR8725569.1 SurA N-terminal domain-containing protein [Frigidibacter sp. ROC022]